MEKKSFKIDLYDCVSHDANARGMVISEDVMKEAVAKFVKDNTDANGKFNPVPGEFNRDESYSYTRLAEVSHLVTDVNLEDMTANIEILDTPKGKILQDMIDTNSLKFGVSAHVAKEVNEEGNEETKIIDIQSIDIVRI